MGARLPHAHPARRRQSSRHNPHTVDCIPYGVAIIVAATGVVVQRPYRDPRETVEPHRSLPVNALFAYLTTQFTRSSLAVVRRPSPEPTSPPRPAAICRRCSGVRHTMNPPPWLPLFHGGRRRGAHPSNSPPAPPPCLPQRSRRECRILAHRPRRGHTLRLHPGLQLPFPGASEPYIYIGLSWGSAVIASAYVAKVAKKFGLICSDPQIGTLRSRRLRFVFGDSPFHR